MANVKIHKPLDTGHQPFKRLAVIGGKGPAGRKAIKAKLMYDCNGGAKKGLKHQQLCVILDGPRQGKEFTVTTNPDTKKAYNRLYNAERKRAAPTNNYRSGFVLKKGVKVYPEGQKSIQKLNAGGRSGVLQFQTAKPKSRPTIRRTR